MNAQTTALQQNPPLIEVPAHQVLQGAPREYNSREADKFVVRMPDALHSKLTQLSTYNFRSLNSEVLAAIEMGLKKNLRTQIIFSLLKESPLAAEVEAAAKAVDLTSGRIRKFILRLPDDWRGEITSVAPASCMNAWVVDCLREWVTTQHQIEMLLASTSRGAA